MSLDFSLNRVQETEVFTRNITHNLGKMAKEAGLYEALWRPYRLMEGFEEANTDYEAEMSFEDSNPVFAGSLIPILEKGLADLKDRPEHYKQFDSENGWGTYVHFVPFVEEVLAACRKYPDATIEVDR